MARELLKEYKNGNKLWGTRTFCAKCNGTGKVIWTKDDHLCYDCNGKGWYWLEEREYTPENLAKREAQLAKKRAAQEAENAQREAERAAEEARREEERLAEIERNRGNFIGNVGDKITITATLVNTFSYETHFGCHSQYVTGYVLKTDEGNTVVYKTTGSLSRKVYTADNKGHFRDDDGKGWYDYETPEEGTKITIKGTVKAHEEYGNVNQTILTRAKWIA